MMDGWTDRQIDRQTGGDVSVQGTLKHIVNQMVLSNQFSWRNETHKRNINGDHWKTGGGGHTLRLMLSALQALQPDRSPPLPITALQPVFCDINVLTSKRQRKEEQHRTPQALPLGTGTRGHEVKVGSKDLNEK